jgi:hypothetical protein
MKVYRELVTDLLVGGYLQVVSHVPNEDQRPECLRRIEKLVDVHPLLLLGQRLLSVAHPHLPMGAAARPLPWRLVVGRKPAVWMVTQVGGPPGALVEGPELVPARQGHHRAGATLGRSSQPPGR